MVSLQRLFLGSMLANYIEAVLISALGNLQSFLGK